MNPIELIERDVEATQSQPIERRTGWLERLENQLVRLIVPQLHHAKERHEQRMKQSLSISRFERLSILPSFDTYTVTGRSRRFDFPCLPTGSLAYYVANDSEAIHLTRQGKEIETVLSREWTSLPKLSSVELASLILPFYDGGIGATHLVIANTDSLRAMCERSDWPYRLNEKVFNSVKDRIGCTETVLEGVEIKIRAITLVGWMHRKRNLGIETITIARNGRVTFLPRKVLSTKIFRSFPEVAY